MNYVLLDINIIINMVVDQRNQINLVCCRTDIQKNKIICAIIAIADKLLYGGITMARPTKYSVHLSDDEVKFLRSLLKKKGTSETICNRCRILLNMDKDHPPVFKQESCAASLGISRATIANTVARYSNDGLDSLLKLKRNVNSNNARRKVDGRAEARLIEIACGPVPEGHSRWTLRS